MKKARLATLVICLLALALLLSACGGDAGDGRGDVVEEPQVTAGDFYGCWEYEEYDNWLCINKDGTYEWYNPDGTCTNGEYTIDGVELLMNDGELFFVLDGEGGMIDSEGDRLFKSSLPEAWPGAVEEEAGFTAIAADFSGCWKYDDYDMYIVLYEDMTWQLLDSTGFSYINHAFEYEENLVYLLEESGSVYLTLTFEEGVLTDSDGDTLYPAPWPTGEEETNYALPSVDDELTQSIELPGSDGDMVWYPELMTVSGDSSVLSFTAANREDTNDFYSSIVIQRVAVNGYDDAMSQGYDSAKAKLAQMMDQVLEAMYGDKLIQSIGSDFQDHGNYFTYDEYVWVDSSIYTPSPDTPVRGALQIRYVGPTGYVVVMSSLALEDRIATYYAIGKNMMDSIGLEGDWSTAPKPKPTTGGSGGAWSDTGDYGTAYYWYDEDGDIWYWNGYEDIFIGFGDDYYIEDGQYYESNDAGWADDYYYDDYDGWGDDFYYDDYYDDYYWSGDYGDTYDYYY